MINFEKLFGKKDTPEKNWDDVVNSIPVQDGIREALGGKENVTITSVRDSADAAALIKVLEPRYPTLKFSSGEYSQDPRPETQLYISATLKSAEEK